MAEGATIKTTDLIEFASDPGFAVDSDMRVVGWNSAAETLLGYSSAEVVGQSCGKVLQAFFLTGEPLCSVLCEGRSCFTTGKKWSIQACRIRHKMGQMITAGISTLVLPSESRININGEAVAIVFMRESQGLTDKVTDIQPLRIFTMGRFGLTIAGKGLNVESWKRKQAVVVLKCLVNQLGRPVHREQLIEWLWPDVDPERGWERLKVTISFLRAKLRSAGLAEETIETLGQSYLLRRDAVWVDANFFENLVGQGKKALKEGNPQAARICFEEADSLYQGGYFENDPYADWCAEERVRLHEVFLELLSGMAKYYREDGLFLEASQVCRRALTNDPCRESFLRTLLESLAELDQIDWAVAQFESWRRSLDEEYGLQPTHETMRVYHRIVGNRNGKSR